MPLPHDLKHLGARRPRMRDETAGLIAAAFLALLMFLDSMGVFR